jgi:intracellular multiplication protein IcmW
MADLSHKSSVEFWQSFMNGAVYPIIEFIEGTEHFAEEHNANLTEDLERVGHFLGSATALADGSEEYLVKVCAPIYLSQKLRIMQLADALSPGCATRMIKKAEEKALEDKSCEIFLKRNLLFERLRIVSRIFTEERIQLVQGLYEA